ncbi:hypothetical protein OV450_4676 [Actinobacteria bacterium OV450]|nr:hypothetical protein OV450_4676 [Actinobacteria bacterium OV450]
MAGLEGAVVAAISLIGLWLGHNYRRQVRLQLSEHVLHAYRKLWQITALSPSDRRTTMTRQERVELAAALNDWYYADGHGMLLPAPTRRLFFALRHNLLSGWTEMQPPSLVRHLGMLDSGVVESVAACACNRELSLLRTQLKSDLSLYTGGSHLRLLRQDEADLLKSCGVSLSGSKGLKRLIFSTSRPGLNPCACARCPGEAVSLPPIRRRGAHVPRPSESEAESARTNSIS